MRRTLLLSLAVISLLGRGAAGQAPGPAGTDVPQERPRGGIRQRRPHCPAGGPVQTFDRQAGTGRSRYPVTVPGQRRVQPEQRVKRFGERGHAGRRGTGDQRTVRGARSRLLTFPFLFTT